MAELLADIPEPLLLGAIRAWARSEDYDLDESTRQRLQVGLRFPKPGPLRVLAGAKATAEAFEWTLGLIRAHGAALKPIGGRLVFGEDGIRALGRMPDTEVPEIPTRIKRTIERVGKGSMAAGLNYLSDHPAASKADGDQRLGDRIESNFRAAYMAVEGD